MRWKCGLGGKGANFLRTGLRIFLLILEESAKSVWEVSVGAGNSGNMNFLKENV